MTHTFVSYVRADSERVRRLCHSLNERGIKTWLDREELQPGQRWKQEIKGAIKEGAFFLACFSSAYRDRQRTYMNEELTLAIEELRLRSTDRAWFIPVLLDPCEVPDRSIGGGESLRDLQWVDLSENWDTGIEKLSKFFKPESQSGPPEDVREAVLGTAEALKYKQQAIRDYSGYPSYEFKQTQLEKVENEIAELKSSPGMTLPRLPSHEGAPQGERRAIGTCRYCGGSASIFSTQHNECKKKHDQAPRLLARWAEEALDGRLPMQTFAYRLHSLQQDYYLRPDEIRPVVAAAMSKAGERFLKNGLLTEQEERLLGDIQVVGGITMSHIGAKELVSLRAEYGFSRWDYAGLLRDNFFKPKESLEKRREIGKAMAQITELGPPFAFRLAADEFLGDIEDSIVYCRTKTTRQYVGCSQGISLRLGQGVCYLIGSFRRQTVEQAELQRVDIGRFAYSNRAFYFWGEQERIRIPIDGILSHEADCDTIIIWCERANAKPEVFHGDTGFGWYIANVIANIHLMDRNDPMSEEADDDSMLKVVT